tara:strand:+ start:14 stop:526 length:513 start_codon:yes stop_codon:yes gene_type:complete
MQLNKSIVLVGMMGSGKSTIGYLLSKKLALKFIDIDREIEKETNERITNIFKFKGEENFRKIEEKITLKILKSQYSVIALGGGGFLNTNIRKEALSKCITIWLNWNNSTIIKRITKSKKRPVAYDASNSEIIKMISDRSKVYSLSKFKINCEKTTKNMIVKKISKIYERL